jgi:hypothetical protein
MPLLDSILAVALALAPGPPAASPPRPAAPALLPTATAAQVPWGPDERMDFDLVYLGFTAGRSSISVGPIEGGVAPLQLATRNAGVTSFLTFSQILVSDLDLVTLLPRSSRLESVQPSGYRHTDTTVFDRATGQATVRVQARTDQTHQVEVPPETLDFVTMLFRLRMLPLHDGATHAFQVLAGRKVSAVVAEVVGREQVTTAAGRFATIKVRIPTGFAGKFGEKNPSLVWYSDDWRRLVVKLSVDFVIGRAEARLTHYQPGLAPVGAGVDPAPSPVP